MIYKYFEIPDKFCIDLKQANKKIGAEYFEWFMSIKDKRINILEEAVKSTEGFEFWLADLSIDSLYVLQNWFEIVVEKRPTTEDEKKAEIRLFAGSKLEEYFENRGFTQWTLSEITESICLDVGIYFGEVLVKNNPGLKWGQNITRKNEFHNNYPAVLSSIGPDFYPDSIRTSALKVIEGIQIDWQEFYKVFIAEAKQK